MNENINENQYENRIRELVRLLKYYDYEFHIKGNQLISEYERDGLRRELEELEEKYPQYILKDSPSFYVGIVQEDYKIIKRKVPMLSLKHSYDKEEIIKWIEKHSKYGDFIIESKFDGVAVSAVYIDGILDSLSLRGNGYEGEDITKFAPYIHNLPLKIQNENIEIRGEVCLRNGNSNSRSLVSGYLRSKIPYKWNCDFIPYYVDKFFKRSEGLEYLKQFMKIEKYYLSSNSSEIISMSNRFSTEYETDGIVIKIDNKENNLGFTDRYLKDSIAYKFQNEQYETKVINIQWNIGRKGQLIPVLIIDPIEINGVIINKVTAHNKRRLNENPSIGINSKITIERVGNVVPQIQKIIESTEPPILTQCPFCSSDLIETNIHYVCKNPNCSEKIYKKLIHFFQQLDFKGINKNIIYRFEILNDYLYSLRKVLMELKETSWIINKNDQKAFLVFSEKRLNISKERYLECLGIEGVNNLLKIKGLWKERFEKYLKENQKLIDEIYEILSS
jgi:DNA ligase (NAD+)